MADVCLKASDKRAHLEVTLAVTTEACQEAQARHALKTTAAIGLGRLLTATGLVGVTSKRPGTTSIQILSKGRVKQLYADATEAGEVRGFSRAPALDHPIIPDTDQPGRLSIAAVTLPGQVSVVRSNERGEYGQSAAPMTSGEIDRDVESFLIQSDQIPTVLTCETLLDRTGKVVRAGGVLVQAMPDGDIDALMQMRTHLVDGGLAALLAAHDDDDALLAAFAPHAEVIETPSPIRWQCRCSKDRVVGALQLIGPEELAEMAGSNESAKIDCDFCGAHYVVSPAELLAIFKSTIKAEG